MQETMLQPKGLQYKIIHTIYKIFLEMVNHTTVTLGVRWHRN